MTWRPGAAQTVPRPLWDGPRKGVQPAASRTDSAVLLMGRLDVTPSGPGRGRVGSVPVEARKIFLA